MVVHNVQVVNKMPRRRVGAKIFQWLVDQQVLNLPEVWQKC